MIVQKPTWLRHAGLQIFSIDTHPNGLCFATAGGDHKVRIWNMRPLAEKESESDTKLLATLGDHLGSVKCVRWTKCGRLIASGSDDGVVLVHERRPGSGTTEFGSGKPPDVENWKALLTLRGHTADVVDLGWSPDDTQLASCSLDNTVRIWQASTGATLAVLSGHKSLVRGLTWDPIGSFLATQSDDKSVIIWRTGSWSMVKRVEGPWEETVESTFFRRLGWSPCGHFIATTHGFQNRSHTAPVLERGEWTNSFDFVGHNAPVVAVRFNHSMFRKMKNTSLDEAAAAGGNGVVSGAEANGDSSSNTKEAAPYNVIAIGSQDCCISVLTTEIPHRVIIEKHFFQQCVVDLSWSPDGYTLFCCSLDGSVASFQFEVKELGGKISDAEKEELKKSRYGDFRVRQASVAESPAQLIPEAAAATQWGRGNVPNVRSSETSKAVPEVANGAVAPEVPTKLPAKVPPKPPQAAALGCADVHNDSPVPNVPPVRVTPSPDKQTGYRRPDARVQIIPEPLGPSRGEDVFGNGALLSSAKYDAPNTGMADIRKQGNENLGPSIGSETAPKRKLREEYIRPDIAPAKRSKERHPTDSGEMGVPVHQLYPSETSDDRDFNFDIILFHSLQGAGVEKAWKSTWVSLGAGPNGEDVCWPAVWLPEDLDGIRVLSVSYEADATKYFGMEDTEDRIEDIGENLTKIMKQYGIGQRRFLLVGHGFGGLVIKSLISEMKRLSHLPDKHPLDAALRSTAETFLKHLQGIAFYAVPHRSVDILAFVNHLESQIQLSKPMRRLKSSPKKMEKLSIMTLNAFNNKPRSIIALAEGQRTNGEWIVPYESAMQLAGEHHCRVMDCNHNEVCKPTNKQHMSYWKLLELLKLCGAGKVEEPPYPSLPTNRLGIEDNMTNLVKLLEKESKVGVVGMGGIGKTTLVKAFYCKKSVDFEERSILLDVYKSDILDCQRCLLKDIVKDGHYDPPGDKERANTLLRKFLPEKRVLIVLDDVGHDSVDHLIPKDMKLHPGSKIILTSRNWSDVENHVTGRLDMKLLTSFEATRLFCLHAFEETSCPDKNLQDVSKDIVAACGRLPLSLVVVGSFLLNKRGQSNEYWRGVLGKVLKAQSLDGGVNEKLWSTLRISFDDLDACVRGRFLDVACFFYPGISSNVTKEEALVIWGSGEAILDLENLINRHLVTIDENRFLSMHDQLRAMGRNIVKTSGEYKHTRIWEECDGLKYQNSNNLQHLEGLYLANKSYNDISPKQMEKIHNLRILIMKNCDVQTIEFLNNLKLEQLRWVFLLQCSIENLPSFSSSRMMTMYKVEFELEQIMVFARLTAVQTLGSLGCSRLELLPRALQTLSLLGCLSLELLPREIGNLTALTTLNLSCCSSLKQLPHEIGNLTALTTMNLSRCSILKQLPHEIGNLTALTTLNLSRCSSLKQLPHEIGNLTALMTLDLEGCSSLKQLPHEIGNLTALTTSDLSCCFSLEHLPHEIGNLTALTTSDLSCCFRLEHLPHEIGNLTALTTLNLSRCPSLKQLPHEIGNLTALTTLDLEGCLSLKQLPHEIGNLTALTTLDLVDCSSLKQLPHEIGNLTALTTLGLEGCSSLKQLPHEIGNLTALTTLDLWSRSSLKQLPHEIGNLTALTTLDLEDCSSLKQLPHEIGNLTALTTLNLGGCSSLEHLPHEIGNLTALTTLDLEDCSSLKQLPHEIGNLTALTTLDLEDCSSLKQLPHEIGNLTALTTLNLWGCSSLKQLPHEISNLTALTTLDLEGCSSLKQLSHGIGNLTALTTLNLWGCSSLKQLPHEIGNLTALTTLDLEGCSSLKQLPHGIGNLTALTTLNLS